jgi:phosphate transport system substrate-binding protein
MRKLALIALLGTLAVGSVLISACQPKLTLDVRGSDTMVNLSAAWAEAYMGKNKNATIAVQGGGTGTGIAQLIAKNCNIAMASRPIKSSEIDQGAKAGLAIKEVTVAFDGVVMVVHPSNPVSELTIEQLSLILRGEVTNWKDVGGNDQAIVVLARDTASGTHAFVKELVVQMHETQKNNQYGPNTQFLSSTNAIVTEVSQNTAGIGYVGLGYLKPEIKALKVKKDANSAAVLPSVATVKDKSYPIARGLYYYLPQEPAGAVKAYIDWIKSAEGQALVAKLGFVPIN